MPNEEQLAILEQGVEVWNKWREDNPKVKINLRESNLSRANLIGAELSRAVLIGANLAGAHLMRANLIRAYLSGADLTKAHLGGANLCGSDLTRATLSGADLIGANLSGTNCKAAYINGANLSGANLSRTNLIGANLNGSDLNHTSLIETNLTNAILTGCKIYGISAWNLKLEGAEQSDLVITRYDEPTVMVDELEVAQFIYLLLNRKKLRDVLNTMTQKGVLILGRFADGGLDVLQVVAGEVRKKGYLPMLFDFDKCDSLNFTQTVKVMVGLSRFVIADLSGPSVLKELEATVPFHNIPFIPIIEEGREHPSMSVDLTIYHWFHWPPVLFANKEKLVEKLQETVIDPAEKIGKTREERRAILFPNTHR